MKGRIYFGTFPSEVRPEFVTEEMLSLVTTILHEYKDPFRRPVRERQGTGSPPPGAYGGRYHPCSRSLPDIGLDPVVDFIVGIPGETDDEQRDTLALIRWVAGRGSVHVHRFMPLPGTALAGTATRGLLDETRRVLGRLALQGKLTGTWGSTADSVFYPSFE